MATISAEATISTNISLEAGDSWVAGQTITTRTTDYKRPLYLRDENFNRLYATDIGAITDFFGVSGSTALCKSDDTVTIGAYSDNVTRQTQYSSAFNFTEIDDLAVITGCDVQITARTPGQSSGGSIGVGFDHKGNGYNRVSSVINLTDQFQTFNTSIDFYDFGEQFADDGIGYKITAGDTTVESYNAGFPFTADIVGQTIVLGAAGPGGSDLISRVTSFTDGDEIEIADAASTTVDSSVQDQRFTVYGDSGALGQQPRIVLRLQGLDLFDTTGYEISEFKVRLTYTGKTLLTTGFVRQDLDQLIPNSDDFEFRHLHSITELGRSPYTYQTKSAGGIITSFPSPWSIGLKNDSGALTDFTADFTELGFIDVVDLGVESDEGNSSGEFTGGRFFYPQSQTDIKMLQLIGSVGNWHHRQATRLTMDDVRSAGFRVRHFDTSGDVSSYTHLAPVLNVGYLPKLTAEADLSANVSTTAIPTQTHRLGDDVIDDMSVNFTTTTLGGFLLDDGASVLNTAFDLQNTGPAGIRFAGESDLDFAFDTVFSGLLATTAESYLTFDTTVSLAPLGTTVTHTTTTDNISTAFDLTNTGLAGMIRSGFTIDPTTQFDITDLADDQTIIIKTPNPSQVYTTEGYTRTLTIPLQGEDRAHERHLYIDHETRVITIPIQGEDRAHERHLYIGHETRTIKAEQLEE